MNRQNIIRVLISPNAFKGSLTAVEAAHAIVSGLEAANRCADEDKLSSRKVMFEARILPLADGGDGTLETLVEATKGVIHETTVRGPLGEPVIARWGQLGSDSHGTAVIEMAEASGLRLLSPEQYNPMKASTHGTGELMLAAVEAGCSRLVVGIGGSATNDGGAGMATALGARLLNGNGVEIEPGGAGLGAIESIDLSHWKLPENVSVQAACDVNNPLTGPTGASAIYGPQKGADLEMVKHLDGALAHYAEVLRQEMGIDVSRAPGAGAAGGLGAGLMAFCKAELRPGSELILDAVGFDTALQQADLVITGEGMLDSQTANGKVIAVVAAHCGAFRTPCIALVGAIGEGGETNLGPLGLSSAFCIASGPMSLKESMRNAAELLRNAACRVGNTIRIATVIGHN